MVPVQLAVGGRDGGVEYEHGLVVCGGREVLRAAANGLEQCGSGRVKNCRPIRCLKLGGLVIPLEWVLQSHFTH